MTEPADRFAAAAARLAGTPFRLHGRDPATGLDCVGLVAAALAACGRRVHPPAHYRLRNAAIDRWLGHAPANGLVRAAGPVARGDILCTCPGPGQHHLLVALGSAQAVHAHAGLGRVVIQPIAPTLRPLLRWRLDPQSEQTWQP